MAVLGPEPLVTLLTIAVLGVDLAMGTQLSVILSAAKNLLSRARARKQQVLRPQAASG
jgi:hypothetical protein